MAISEEGTPDKAATAKGSGGDLQSKSASTPNAKESDLRQKPEDQIQPEEHGSTAAKDS